MKVSPSPLKFFNFLAFLSLVVVFVFLPTIPGKEEPTVKSATTANLLLPQPKPGSVAAPSVSAQAVYIFDPDSGTTIYEKNSADRLYPASTTKLMTALIALKIYELDQVLTVKTAANATGQTMDLARGDQLTVENLLYGLLVDSGNDAAVALAENYCAPQSPQGGVGSCGYSQFIAKMNEEAKRLGLSGTHFANVTGFENPDHYTTARDLTLIAREAINNAVIRKIVSTKEVVFYDITAKKRFAFESTNKLLSLPGVRGLKTGWTPASGECLVTLVTRDGKSILLTVLNSVDRFGESEKLINWVYDNFDWKTI
ncbi:MAG: D-alanyl-D-alanine carboxypeptidase family protein [Patescibacteria group bacterium]